MVNEFKLSFTAQQIDEKLGKIDGLAAQKYVDEALLTKQPIGDYVLKSDIPDISSAIIDVTELPTENINEGAFYRLAIAKFVENGDITGWTCYYVNELPPIGEPVSTDMVNITAYYNAQDDEVYGYADEMISAAGGVPVGWYPIGVLGQAFDITWGGVITDANDDDGDSIKVLLIKDYCIYQDEWCKIPFACEKAPEIDIQWDGDIADRPALDMSLLGYEQGVYFVKVSDIVLTTDKVIDYMMWASDGNNPDYVSEYMIDNTTYPGAFIISQKVVVVYSADELAAALGIPSGIYTNGIYFYMHKDYWYINRFNSPSRITKIDEKFLPDINADSLGLATVATSGNYNDLYNKPDAYTDVIRYSVTQNLSSTQKGRARNNIDVYSKSEVNGRINEEINSIDNLNLDCNIIYATMPDKNEVCCGDNKIVIYNAGGEIAFSIDGINWTRVNIDSEIQISDACYGDGMFVVVGGARNAPRNVIYAYSTNGLDWTVKRMNTYSNYTSVCYGDGKFVIATGSKILYSSNLSDWSSYSIENTSLRHIKYYNGKFIVWNNTIGNYDIFYSTNLTDWSEAAKPDDYTGIFDNIIVGGKILCYVTTLSGDKWLYSEDGTDWYYLDVPFTSSFICYGDGKFIATEYYISKYIYYSTDFINWTKIDNNAKLEIKCYINNKFIAANREDFTIFYSLDGMNWNGYEIDRTYSILQSSADVTSDVATSIKPYLNLTASDVGALPAGSIENVPIYLTSPNGSRFQLAVDDNGNLTATAIAETIT